MPRPGHRCASASVQGRRAPAAPRLHDTRQSTPVRPLWPALPSSHCAGMQGHDPPNVELTSAAVAFFGKRRRRVAMQFASFRVGAWWLCPQARPQAWQPHAVAQVVGSSMRRMKLPNVWPVTGPGFPRRVGRKHIVSEGSPSWAIILTQAYLEVSGT